MESTKDIEKLAIDTVRILSADAVQKANSGHPGTAMALAPMGHVLWSKFLNYNPQNPDWANRDRFILSAGHACILQYSFLYLTGYDLSLDDIKQFRQLNSKTAGHPEYGLAPGVDVTTGPLGQGFANGVGFAIAQKHLAARYNKPGFDLFNYNIYAITSDGDMMEGVTSEAASLAGHLQLGNLIYLYDDNHISIEGSTDIAFNEDVSARFRSYGWQVQEIADVNDTHALELALINAKAETQKPSLIRVRSLIAYGSPNKSGTAGSHGSPLGADEIKLVKKFFGFDPEKSFEVPAEVLKYYNEKGARGIGYEEKWNKLFADYKAKYPELAAEYELAAKGGLPEGWADKLPSFKGSDPKMATRQASGKVLNAIAASLPNLIGGAADLSPSTETNLKEFDSFTSENRNGRNFHFGIREHAMGSALNGMALTKGVIPFGATFLMFSEYMRPPIRLAAIMKINPIFVYTHDSIGLGEDGTTHQPVEQLASLRSIPNITVIRPADANETAHAWRVAIEHKGGPVVLVFTRQGLPILDQDKYGKASDLEKGAYIVSEGSKGPDLILMATGSEVSLIMQAQEKLEAEGISTRVVSMPSWELFEKQDAAYKEKVLPKANRKRLAVEMASPMGWHKYTTDEGDMLGMTTFGESAPADDLYKHFGFTVDNVVNKAKALL
ncbi:transketolase [Mucilaginibacter pocheonensis]|uniref:Transketolase n=1 Tax=Mucilaginibacter pocheonensis TaxID=398050 RepID=A0ABU1TA82_9SPHI|nr:transketolase [Mucilaginibacter pocheonensis]MDR6942312.1 transketolase [Mucilaginibacter pocheonensis]